MANRTVEEALRRSKRFFLTNAGSAYLGPAFVYMAIVLSNSSAILAQTPAVGAPEFDAASIKPISCVGRCGVGGGTERLTFKPGMVTSRGVNGITPRGLILEAYHLAEYQLIGGPGWLDSDRIAVEAKAGVAADQTQLRQMLQRLLGERFKLVTHRESREMSVYVMTVGKNGTNLREFKPGEPSPPQPPDAFIVLRSPMEDFIAWFSGMGHVDRPILDKTGLDKGVYFFGLKWNGDEDIKVAVADSFGLKFESQKAAVDLVVIDHVEKPSEN